jgi:hypothetical protein
MPGGRPSRWSPLCFSKTGTITSAIRLIRHCSASHPVAAVWGRSTPKPNTSRGCSLISSFSRGRLSPTLMRARAAFTLALLVVPHRLVRRLAPIDHRLAGQTRLADFVTASKIFHSLILLERGAPSIPGCRACELHSSSLCTCRSLRPRMSRVTPGLGLRYGHPSVFRRLPRWPPPFDLPGAVPPRHPAATVLRRSIPKPTPAGVAP